MDLTLIFLIIALIVVVALFVVALRSGASRSARSAAVQGQTAGRAAIAAPRGETAATRENPVPAANPGEPRQGQVTAPTPPEPVAVASQDASSASAGESAKVEGVEELAPIHASEAAESAEDGRSDASARYGVEGVEPAHTALDEAAGAKLGAHEARDDSAVYTAAAPSPVTTATAPPRTEASASASAVSDRVAPADADTPAMELVGQPPTRSGVVMLAVSPQRLPFRFAELQGEQRQLEESITIAHRRIDDVEMGPDPGSGENRVRLNVLRQDLAQKQERLREVLFLQDGYRWVQQQMAPDRQPQES